MRRVLGYSGLSFALAACAGADPAVSDRSADPVPQAIEGTPASQSPPQRVLQGPGELQVRAYLQDVVSDRFGRDAWSAFSAAPTAVAAASIAGRWATSHQPRVNLLIRTRAGWRGQGGTAPVRRDVSDALDALLADRRLWAEPARYPEVSCPDSGADVLAIRHAGKAKFVYQSGGCGTANLSTRLIHTILTGSPGS